MHGLGLNFINNGPRPALFSSQIPPSSRFISRPVLHCNASKIEREREREMGFGALRSIIRPLSRTLISQTSTRATTSFLYTSSSAKPELRSVLGSPFRSQAPWFPIVNHFHSLTDTRFPKRRPSNKPRRKRASMKPPGSSYIFF